MDDEVYLGLDVLGLPGLGFSIERRNLYISSAVFVALVLVPCAIGQYVSRKTFKKLQRHIDSNKVAYSNSGSNSSGYKYKAR